MNKLLLKSVENGQKGFKTIKDMAVGKAFQSKNG